MSKNLSKIVDVPELSVDAKLRAQLIAHLDQLKGKKILVVGDSGVDEYIMGEVRRISPEAPVPVLEVDSEDTRLGLAGNVAQNIASLGGEPLLVSVIGKDAGAEMLNHMLKKAGVSTDYLVADASRPTTRKARVMAKHHHLVRVDYEVRKYVAEQVEAEILNRIVELLPRVDALIVEDYGKGMLGEKLLKSMVAAAKAKNVRVLVDPYRTTPSEFYRGVDLIKPNFDEAVALSGLNYDDLRDHPNKVIEVGRALQKKTGAKELVMTRGKDGMTIFSGEQITQVPTFSRQVFDVTGAGDTVIATLTMGLASGLELQKSCMLANFAAGVVVGQVGCVPCSLGDLKDYIETAGKSVKTKENRA